METGKPGFVSVPVHGSSVAAQTENKMDIQAPLMAVYVQAVPPLPPHPYPQTQLPAAPKEPATLHLSMPPLFSKEMLPFLTLSIAGLQSQQQGPGLAAAAPATRPKSAGKHVCPHCGRDCMKPSVLEKHLRCHTGERPYPCTTCGISFKTQSNLYKHKRTQAHARLSSESEQSSLCSQDSLHSSRDTCTSSLSLDTHCEDSGNPERDIVQPPAEIINPTSTLQVPFVEKQGPDTGWTPVIDTGNEHKELSSQVLHIKPAERLEITRGEEKQNTENKKPPLTPNRHLPLQRQEATLFSKQWEHSITRGKSQSHESTDSGFSESSDYYLSPGSLLPDYSMESLTESSLELLETPRGSQTPADPGQSRQEPKASIAQRENRTLEERISKLISENDAVVEDKHLENVRPRKTVLSKQGSIDLPMPYTYKDSFHFDMRSSKATNAGFTAQRPDRTGKPSMYCSVPTQCSTSVDHAPLIRSSSLPFSATLLHSERNSPTSSLQRDYVTLARKASFGQIFPSGFVMKSVDQRVSNHRPLVRQAAVDCNHATEGLSRNSSVEEACASSLSSDGDSVDIYGEPSNRRCHRKKAQKFAYNKWYMYGGGTFKKLYDAEKGCDSSVVKARKSLANSEHEGVQGTTIQRRFSAVNREKAATTTGSMINSTGSGAAVCHPSCLPANLPPIVSVDLNQKPGQLNSSCASLKSPLLKNVSSLSTLQSSSIGSLDTHNTDGAEAEKLNNNEKHTGDPQQHSHISQHCGGQIPSDRKKQKTDDVIICPPGTQIDPNTSKTSTQPFPSVVGGVAKPKGRPQIHTQDTNISFINLQSSQKPVQLKRVLSPPCIINANEMSVSSSSAISIVSTAKTSFLPKYQLKLPTAVEADTYPSPQTLNRLTEKHSHDSTTNLSSSHIYQTSVTSSSSPEKKGVVHFVPPPVHGHTHSFKRTNSSAQSQSVSILMATSHCQSVTYTTALNQNVLPSLATAHGQFTTTTTIAASGHYHHAKLYTTFIQNAPAKPVTASMPNLPTRPLAPTTQNSSAPPIIAKARSLMSAAGFTSPPHAHPSLSNAHASLTSGQLNPANRVPAGLSTIPRHVVPYDPVQQPAAQNVFHVRTADLHICLQIISDEQLALIEPQIERLENAVGTGPSQRNNLETVDPEVVRSKVRSSVTVESMHEGTGRETTGHQREEDRREPLSSHNTQSIKPPLLVNSNQAQENKLVTEHADVNQATKSVESTPSKSPGVLLGPLSHAHRNMLTKTMKKTDSAMSALVLLKGMKLERNQTPNEEHVLPHNSSAERHHLPERSVSQEGIAPGTLPDQHKLSLAGMASSSPSTAAQNSTGSGLAQEGSQHKHIHQKAECLAGKLKTECEASAFGEARLSLQACFSPSSSAESGDGLPGKVPSLPNNADCITQRDANPQAPVYSSDLWSRELANVGSVDSVGPLDRSAPSQVMTLSESSQDNINSNLLETCLGLFTSVADSIQVERPIDVTGVLSTNRSPAAGLGEGGSLAGCAVQKEPKTQDHVKRTSGQLDRADWEPNLSQRNGGTDHLCMEGQEERGGVVEDSKTRGRTMETEDVPEQREAFIEKEDAPEQREAFIEKEDAPEQREAFIVTEDVPEQREAGSGSNGRTDEIVEEQENGNADSYKNSWLSKHHHHHHQQQQHLSQTQFGMSDHPPLPRQQEASTSGDPNALGSSDANESNSPWPESQAKHIYFSQQQQQQQQQQQLCEINSNSNHNQQAQIPFESNGTLQINQLSGLAQTHLLCQSETSHQHTQQPILNETIIHQGHHTQQDQEETDITSPAVSLPLREMADRVNNSSLPNCSNNSTYSTESQRVTDLLAAVRPATSTYSNLVSHSVHVNRATVRVAANSQAISDGPSDNTIHPPKSWSPFYPDPDDKLEKEDQSTHVTMNHSGNAVRVDGSSKYQSLFSTGQLLSYHLAEVLTSGARPVQSGQEDPDDTSSSDDEGKLIIEL